MFCDYQVLSSFWSLTVFRESQTSNMTIKQSYRFVLSTAKVSKKTTCLNVPLVEICQNIVQEKDIHVL